MTTPNWQTPTFIEIDMNAEIGAYQADGPNPPDWAPPSHATGTRDAEEER